MEHPLCINCTSNNELIYCVGWYCNGSSISATPSENGGECQAGEFCPVGSYQPTPCTPGYYCETSGLSAPTANCTEG